MNRWRPAVAALALVLVPIALSGQGTAQAPPQAGAAQVSGTRLVLLRSISGTGVVEQGSQQSLQDTRTAFYIPDDKQLSVYFEWEGRPGPHHFEGLWKDPNGKVVVVSSFDYEAKQKRCGAYWQLNLTGQMQTGWWALEARVDGEVAGSHSFEIIAKERPPLAARPLLDINDLYQRALSASVFIEKLDAGSQRLGVGSGFRLAPEGLVVTAFHLIDGATTLRVSAGGRQFTVESILAWDRRRDFAVFAIPELGPAGSLPPAPPDSWKIGDRIFALDVPAEGNRVIVDANIIGRHTFPEIGERLNLSTSVHPTASGGPVMNEHGEALGVVQAQGRLLPGSWSLRNNYSFAPLFGSSFQTQTLALPLSMVPNPLPAPPTSLLELARRGLFVAPLVGHEDVMGGGLAREIRKEHGFQQPVDERSEFRRAEDYCYLYLHWRPRRKGKYLAGLRFFDLDNRAVGSTKPVKLSLAPDQLKSSSWKINFGQMPPGLYRVDVMLNDTPVWRTFFRVVE